MKRVFNKVYLWATESRRDKKILLRVNGWRTNIGLEGNHAIEVVLAEIEGWVACWQIDKVRHMNKYYYTLIFSMDLSIVRKILSTSLPNN